MSHTPRQYTRKNDVEIVTEETLYQGFVTVKSSQLRFRLHAGDWSEVITRELIAKNSAVGVLAYDPVLAKVVLIEQFRPGALNDELSPWLIEIIAGLMDKNESAMELAKREAEEEANLTILALTPICQYWVSPGISNERMMLYCAKVDASQAGGIYGLSSEAEDIKVHVVDLATAYQWLDTGMINNAPTIIALQWLRLHPRFIFQ